VDVKGDQGRGEKGRSQQHNGGEGELDLGFSWGQSITGTTDHARMDQGEPEKSRIMDMQKKR